MFANFNWQDATVYLIIFILFWVWGIVWGRRSVRRIPGYFEKVDAIHDFFELTYAQYLAIPRSILQSMSDEWQARFVYLLDQLDNHFDWRRPGCWVRFQDRSGHFMRDELADYSRGRRFLTKEEVENITKTHTEAFER